MRRRQGFHTLDKDLGRITHAESAQRYAFRPVWWMGLAMLMIVAGLVLAVGFGRMGAPVVSLAAGMIVAGWLGLAIGSNDVANSLGPAVGAGAIGLLPGLALVALAEIAGASLAGGAVTSRLATGIFETTQLTSGERAPMIMLSALVAAAVWITTASGAGLPVSTSHSIVGGIAGAGMAALGGGAIDWLSLAMIASTWMVTPLISGLLAGAVVVFLRLRVLDAPDRAAAARRWLPPLVGATAGLFAAYLALLGRAHLHNALILPFGLAAGLAGHLLMRRMVEVELIKSDGNPSGKRLFRPPLLVAVTIMGFAHGANDVGNIAGPLSVILAGQRDGALGDVPVAVLAMGGLTIAFGTLLFGRRLVIMVGSGITRLNTGRAFCVALATAATVLAASAFGLPVSTTHVAVGGIFGVGFAREWLDRRSDSAHLRLPAAETRRRMLIRRSHVATIMTAWVVTVPLTAAIGALFCVLILWTTGF